VFGAGVWRTLILLLLNAGAYLGVRRGVNDACDEASLLGESALGGGALPPGCGRERARAVRSVCSTGPLEALADALLAWAAGSALWLLCQAAGVGHPLRCWP
jgi:hypothetical protein